MPRNIVSPVGRRSVYAREGQSGAGEIANEKDMSGDPEFPCGEKAFGVGRDSTLLTGRCRRLLYVLALSHFLLPTAVVSIAEAYLVVGHLQGSVQHGVPSVNWSLNQRLCNCGRQVAAK